MSTIPDIVRDRLLLGPDFTHISLATLYLRGRVQELEEYSDALGLRIPKRWTCYGPHDRWQRYESRFVIWLSAELPPQVIRLPSETLFWRDKVTVSFLHNTSVHAEETSFSRVDVADLPWLRTSFVVAVILQPDGGGGFVGIENVWLGAPYQPRVNASAKRYLSLREPKALERTGLLELSLPVTIEFSIYDAAFRLPEGGFVIIRSDKLIFLDP